MSPFQPNAIIREQFELNALIGTGGFGQVWKGLDKKLVREVAIKRISRFGNLKKDVLLEEAMYLASMQHPNVVVVHDAFEYEGEVLVVMEYLNRGSLHEYLRALCHQGHWVEPSEAFRLVKGILSGLEAVHNAEFGALVHKDLKPANILFDRRREPKICDFGIASLGTVEEIKTAHPGRLEHEGTYGYKSPEQMMGAQLDQRTDLFNAGLIAYLLFGASHPFVDPKFLFDYKEMVIAPYRTLPSLQVASLPADINEFLAKLLAYNPSDRYPSAGDALAELDDLESRYQDMLFERAVELHDALTTGVPLTQELSAAELAEGISMCKRRGFYVQGIFLFEKSGVNFSTLTEIPRARLEADYGVCRRRAGREIAIEEIQRV